MSRYMSRVERLEASLTPPPGISIGLIDADESGVTVGATRTERKHGESVHDLQSRASATAPLKLIVWLSDADARL